MENKINQETLIPIGLAVVLIGGVSMWITDIRSQLKYDFDRIEVLTASHEANIKLIAEINSRLSRIEWRLEERPNKKENK